MKTNVNLFIRVFATLATVAISRPSLAQSAWEYSERDVQFTGLLYAGGQVGIFAADANFSFNERQLQAKLIARAICQTQQTQKFVDVEFETAPSNRAGNDDTVLGYRILQDDGKIVSQPVPLIKRALDFNLALGPVEHYEFTKIVCKAPTPLPQTSGLGRAR